MNLSIKDRVVALEITISRICSDIESEKGTRSRVNADMENRLRVIERNMNRGIGILVGAQIIVQIVIAVIQHLWK